MEFWDKELSDEETEALLDKAAFEIRRRKLQAPATIALELNKPIAFISSQASIVFAPFLVPVFGYRFVHDYGRLLSNKENIDRLLQKLEEPAPPALAPQEDSCPT